MGAGPIAGFEATTVINRKDFGVDLEMPLEGGGVVVGDKITINLGDRGRQGRLIQRPTIPAGGCPTAPPAGLYVRRARQLSRRSLG